MTATDPTNNPDPGAPQGPGAEAMVPRADFDRAADAAEQALAHGETLAVLLRLRQRGAMRILTQHDPQADYHQWWMPGRVQWLDTTGRRNQGRWGSWRWHVAECNNHDCPAVAIIREDAITALLPAEPVPEEGNERGDAI